MSDQEVRWCPGCGDYSILAAVQLLMPELGVRREDMAFVSGIGCAARFPYYMNTYGMHSIHGRAPAIATGLAMARPDLHVWVVTGDGDSLSIGGNHLIHALRRNIDITILLFNNQIYGLTKGQYSPTSELGKVTKSTPFGSLDHPFNPLSLALEQYGLLPVPGNFLLLEGQRQGVEGVVEAAERRRLGDLPELARGRVLPLGEPVDLVVDQQDGHVDVAPAGMDEMVAADREGVAVTGDDPHVQVRASHGQAGGDGRRPPVDRVHPVGVHVVREPGRAADP